MSKFYHLVRDCPKPCKLEQPGSRTHSNNAPTKGQSSSVVDSPRKGSDAQKASTLKKGRKENSKRKHRRTPVKKSLKRSKELKKFKKAYAALKRSMEDSSSSSEPGSESSSGSGSSVRSASPTDFQKISGKGIYIYIYIAKLINRSDFPILSSVLATREKSKSITFVADTGATDSLIANRNSLSNVKKLGRTLHMACANSDKQSPDFVAFVESFC